MRPWSIHIHALGHELAVAFGPTEDAPERDLDDQAPSQELVPCLSESERDMFGFRRFDRPEAY